MKRAALYARVATDDSLDGKALKQQVGLLCEYADLHDYDIMHVYQDVGSGLKEDRPGLQNLMSDAAADMFDVVLLREPTRLFRDMTLLLEYYRRLRYECHVEVVFVLNAMAEEEGDA